MKIWSAFSKHWSLSLDGQRVGEYVSAHNSASPDLKSNNAAIFAITSRDNKFLQSNPRAVHLNPGATQDLDLLNLLSKQTLDVYFSINGLGPNATEAFFKVLPNAIPVFDGSSQPRSVFFEQALWLKHHARHFALQPNDLNQLEMALLIDTCDVLLTREITDVETTLNGFSRVRGATSPRPISAFEIDAMEPDFVSLTVTQQRRAGDVLQLSDLTSEKLGEKGLSPLLAPKLVGRVLRYAIQPHEALCFGHLDDAWSEK